MKTLRIVTAAALFASALLFQAPVHADSEEDRIDALLHQSGYTYEKRAEGVWVVPQKGDSLGDFKVIVAQGEGLVVIFVIIAKKDQMDMGLGLATRMLSMNHEYDRVKVGTDDDGDAFVRLDASLRSMDATEMKEDIHQVAASADEAYSGIKPYLH
ncbi:MAG TPA: hypothetical protein VF651_02070 [Gammaproteobacteria bacterium]